MTMNPARLKLRSPALACLVALAILYTMYFAASLLMPVIVAVLLYFLLAPVQSWLLRLGIARSFGAVLLVSLLVGAAAGAIWRLGEPGAEWLRDAPTSLAEFRAKFRSRPNPLAEVRNASEAVEDAVAEITGSSDGSPDEAPAVQIREPGALETVLSRLPLVAASSVVTVVLTLFLLICGDDLLRRIVSLGRGFAAQRRIVITVRQVQRDIACYLGTVTLINLALGCVVAGVMTLMEVPNPLLWGAVAGVLNFAPYVGGLITAAALVLVGFSAFDTWGEMFGPALVFVAINAVEGQFITPLLLGRRLELSPLAVFLAVLIVGWLWGLVGALIAVPLLASVRIVLSNIPDMRPVANLLARCRRGSRFG